MSQRPGPAQVNACAGRRGVGTPGFHTHAQLQQACHRPATGANERRTADTGSGSAHGVPGLKKSDHTELPCTEDRSGGGRQGRPTPRLA